MDDLHVGLLTVIIVQYFHQLSTFITKNVVYLNLFPYAPW